MISLAVEHLIQSTLFAALIGLVTLCFTNNRAPVRYWLWFAASVKFLIPFSLIVAAGESLRWETAPVAALDLSWSAPVTTPAVSALTAVSDMTLLAALAPIALERGAPGPDFGSGLNLGSVITAIWLIGSALLLCRWTVQWLRLRTVRQASAPAPFNVAIPVRFTRALYEPGLVGIFRPVLLLPEGIVAQLSPAQLTLVIEHELCHWRRRDNLTAAVHMAAELVFWFHPLVWWIGARLVVERERACDESVLATCSNPKAYADSILEVCRFYIRSPLACAPGVAGANLKHRVERIIENVEFLRVSRAKLVLLAAIAAGALLLPMASGLLAPSAVAALPQPDILADTAPPKTGLARDTVPDPVKASAQGEQAGLKKAPLGPAREVVPHPVKKFTPAEQTIPKQAVLEKVSPAVQVAMLAPDQEAVPRPVITAAAQTAKIEDEETVAASTTTQANAPTARPAPPSSSSLEQIVVTAKKIREFVRTRNFVRSYTAPSDFLDQISRWQAPLCVATVGLEPGFNAFVTARIKEIAAQIGAPKAKTEPCGVNLEIIFSGHPQDLLDDIKTHRPELLGVHYPALRKKLATVTHPVQAWYATGTRGNRGSFQLDSYDGFSVPIFLVPGSQLRTGLTSEFVTVVVVADTTKVAGWEIGTIADYIAMTALARARTLGKCQQVPSITNALEDCDGSLKAKSLSPYDMAYLKALYASSGDAPRALQESEVSAAMLKILEKQVAENKAQPNR